MLTDLLDQVSSNASSARAPILFFTLHNRQLAKKTGSIPGPSDLMTAIFNHLTKACAGCHWTHKRMKKICQIETVLV